MPPVLLWGPRDKEEFRVCLWKGDLGRGLPSSRRWEILSRSSSRFPALPGDRVQLKLNDPFTGWFGFGRDLKVQPIPAFL